uniref:Kinase family protein n=1 Tax=Populus alba TaxID=43335 RepID=A0A4U5NPA8_POPAL|nr:kinase family protein [Populus alba]
MTCFSFLCGRRIDSSQESQHMGRDDEELGSIQNVRCYTYRELRNATEGFSTANKIGEGGFGSVYKVTGRLKHGRIAAIKVLSAESRQGAKEFLAEIQAMSEIEHENLVKLYGCCVEDNHRILVYNYLENNSLAQTLLDGEQYLLERTWELYERRELVSLVDASLNGDFNADEACKFLKIGLLCTQDDPNLRPSMSTVVKMLSGRKNVDERKITKPGLISDFMDLKVRAPSSKTKASASTSFNVSSLSDNQDTSILTSENSSSVTMTAFTELYNRSI